MNDALSWFKARYHKSQIDSMQSDGLMTGRLGMAYFHSILYSYTREYEHMAALSEIIEQVFERVGRQESDLLQSGSLKDGLSGLGYMIRFLNNKGQLADEYVAQLEDINEIVFNQASALLAERNYDFLDGPVGMLHYLNYAGADEQAANLGETMKNIYEGKNLSAFYNDYGPLEGVHIGYAHGLCAIAKVLGGCPRPEIAGVSQRIAADLASSAYNHTQYIAGSTYYLPRSLHNSVTDSLSFNFRPVLAWSNSDLNFTVLVHSLSDPALTEYYPIAEKIAKESLKRTLPSQTRITDPRFLYGSAGNLKMYTYLHSKTKDPAYYEAAKKWYDITIDLLDAKLPGVEQPLDFINGYPGAILALAEFEKNIDLGWGGLFLMD